MNLRNPRAVTTLALLLAGATLASAAGQDYAPFLGSWRNVDRETRGITRVKIHAAGSTATLHLWGSCHPEDCEWDPVPATLHEPGAGGESVALTAEIDQGFVKRWAVVRPVGRGNLELEVFSRYAPGDSRSPTWSRGRFVRGHQRPSRPERPRRPGHSWLHPGKRPEPLPETAEDCVSFDPSRLTLQLRHGRWFLMEGTHSLMQFGTNKGEAEEALRIIRRYRLNQHCFVGRPGPSFEYWLVDGRPPRGALPREDCLDFDPEELRVTRRGGRWKIVEGSHLLFDFDQDAGEARQALALMKKHGFTRSCFVGRPDPSMTYLRR